MNRFDTGNDHRLTAKLRIDTQLERKRLIVKKSRFTMSELRGKEEEYNTQIDRKLRPTEELWSLEFNALLTKITSSIRTAVKKVCSMQRLRNPKISLDTERLIEERRKTDRDSSKYADLNRNVKKAIRRDGRSYNMQLIKEAIENNSNMRVLRPGLLRGKLVIHKMNDREEVTVEKDKITGIIENFYRRL